MNENQKTVALSAINKVRRHEQMIKSQTEEIQSLRKALEKSKSYRESKKSDITVTSDRFEIDKLKDDLESKHSIITSMEASQKTMSDLLSDKNAVIESQRLIIDGMKNKCVAECSGKLKELENNLQQRNEEIIGLKDEVKRLEKSAPDEEYEQLMRQVHMERETNAILSSKLEDQKTITQKTEFALEKLEELVSTKSMLIENLQSVILCEKEKDMQKSQPSCPHCDSAERNLTSQRTREINSSESSDNANEDNSLTSQLSIDTAVPGLCETTLKLKGISLHGVVFDGLLLWIDTRRRTIPEDMWKQQVLANFTAEEITNAKNALWDVGNTNDLLGRNVVRKGDSKSTSEIF